MFFLMRDWERDMVEPCLLAREIEVALDIDAASFILPVSVSVVKVKDRGVILVLFDVTNCLCHRCDPVICQFLFFDLLHPFASPLQFLLISTYPASSCNHECVNAKPRHFPWRNAT
jgi:hypothetical protein